MVVSFIWCRCSLIVGSRPRVRRWPCRWQPSGVFVGRLGCGYLLDRIFAPYVAVGFFGAAALGIGLLWSGVGGSLVFVAAMLLGLLVGAELDLMAYMVSRY